MPNYVCQDRAKYASAQDGGVLFDFLLTTACKTCFHPLNAGDLCPACQEFVDEERRKQAEEEKQRFDEWLSGVYSVHVFGIGYVDTRTREGRRYLDD
jgi:hypothetical protein